MHYVLCTLHYELCTKFYALFTTHYGFSKNFLYLCNILKINLFNQQSNRMKKSLLIVSMSLLAGSAFGQTQPIELEHMFAKMISPNGTFVASSAADVDVFNMETGEHWNYPGIFLGLGNAVANDGFAVGSGAGDISVVMRDGVVYTPETLAHFWFSGINGVTPDGTRLVGIANNDRPGIMYKAFYCDIDEDGNVGAPHYLPMPDRDFFGFVPQYSNAVWVSDDGHTIAGLMVDNRGYLSYPILFRENEQGEWSYVLPTAHLFNPEGIKLPDNPYAKEPRFPEFVDFMDEDSRVIYEEEYDNWIMGAGPYPDPFAFMTTEQEKNYWEAYNAYEQWYEEAEDKIEEYMAVYRRIAATTPSFGMNEYALNGAGTVAAYVGGAQYDDLPRREIWSFDIADFDNVTYEWINVSTRGIFPTQILSDGTMMAATPRTGGNRQGGDGANGYIKLPDANDFIDMYEYLGATNPSYADWLNTNSPHGSGLVSVSDDLSVIAGGLIIYNLSDEMQAKLEETNGFFYSYVFTDAKTFAGVEENLVDADNGVYRVFNLQGVNVMTTENKSDLNNLAKGIYIINGKKTVVRK